MIWFFEPVTLMLKNNLTILSKAKVLRGFCFFNYEEKEANILQSKSCDSIEEKLKESEKRYRDIYEHAPFGIFQTTLSGKLLRANPAFARILKYDSAEEIITKTNKTDIARHLFVDPSKRYTLVEKVMSRDGWHSFENLYKCKDGQIICAQILLRAIKMNPEKQMEGFLIDITEKKEAEEELLESQQKYRELVENINDVIFRLDNKGRFVYISPAIKRVAGYEPEEVIGHSFKEFVFPEDFPDAREKLKAALSGKMKPRELRIVKKDGSIAYISSFGRPLMKDGQVKGVISVLTDITERKKSEEILLESYKYLGTVNRQFSVLNSLNKVLEEKDEKKMIDFISLAVMEAVNAEFSGLFKYQNEKRAFQMLSVASKNKMSEKEKSKIFHLTIVSPNCQEKIDEKKIGEIENIEECFKEFKLISLKRKWGISNFKILPIINKGEMKGIFLLGFSGQKGNLVNGENFYDVFSKYVGFILLDIGVFK